jgi:hypothetical protein
MMLFRDPRAVLLMMGIWACVGIVVWLVSRIWPGLISFGG